MRLPASALAALILLAGCTTPAQIDLLPGMGTQPDLEEDWNLQTFHVWWDGGGKTDAAVSVPLPIPKQADAEDWFQWASVTALGDATAGLKDTEHGQVLELSGPGGASFRAALLQPAGGGNGCCAEQFLDMTWTTQDGDGAWYHAGLDGVRVSMRYQADSNWCDSEWELRQDDVAAGWHRFEASPSASCA